MGRKKKYLTEEELRISRNLRRMKYYWNNKNKEKHKALNRYYKLKEMEK